MYCAQAAILTSISYALILPPRRLAEGLSEKRHYGGKEQVGRFSRAAGKIFMSVNFVDAECTTKAKCIVAFVPEVRAVQP